METQKIYIIERSYEFGARLFKTSDINNALHFILESVSGLSFHDYDECKEEIIENISDGFDTFVYLDVSGPFVSCEVFVCNDL